MLFFSLVMFLHLIVIAVINIYVKENHSAIHIFKCYSKFIFLPKLYILKNLIKL